MQKLSFVFFFFTFCFSVSAFGKTWRFISVGPQTPWFPEGSYACDLIPDGEARKDERVYTSFIRIKTLMTHFEVATAKDLVGKEIKGDDADSALENLVLNIMHDGKYKSPEDRDLYDRAIASLAKFEMPDFSDVDSKTVRMALGRLYLNDKEWESFKKSVEETQVKQKCA